MITELCDNWIRYFSRAGWFGFRDNYWNKHIIVVYNEFFLNFEAFKWEMLEYIPELNKKKYVAANNESPHTIKINFEKIGALIVKTFIVNFSDFKISITKDTLIRVLFNQWQSCSKRYLMSFRRTTLFIDRMEYVCL